VDALAIFFLVLGIQLIIAARPALSTAALGLSVGAKFLPIFAFPVLLRRVRFRYFPLPFGVVAALYVPYLGAGWALFRGLREYAERWRHNDSLFGILLALLEAAHPTEPLKAGIAHLQAALDYPAWVEILYHYAYPVYLARIAAVLLVAGLALWLAVRKEEPVRGTFAVLAASLLLSPTVHPWYILWIVPFLALRPHRAWILLTGLVPLSYLAPGPVIDGSHGRPWVGWVEYLPFYILLVGDAIASRRRGRAVTLFDLEPFEAAAPAEERGAPEVDSPLPMESPGRRET